MAFWISATGRDSSFRGLLHWMSPHFTIRAIEASRPK
jgi:hypothetical protein